MTRHAHPTAPLSYPGIREAAAVHIRLSVERSLLVIRAADDYRVAVNVRLQRIVADDLDVLDWMLDAIKKFRLILQAAVDIDIGEIVGQQMVECGSVFRYFGLVPQRFESQHPRGITVLC